MDKCENWNFGNWKLNSEIRILQNYLKIEVLKIKFENQNFEKSFENRIFSDHLKIEVLKIKDLENYLKNGIFRNQIWKLE